MLQGLAILLSLAFVFGSGIGQELKLFYVLFLPLVWIAMRRGVAGTTAAVLLVQIGLIAALKFGGHAPGTVLDFQFLMLALRAHRALPRRPRSRSGSPPSRSCATSSRSSTAACAPPRRASSPPRSRTS